MKIKYMNMVIFPFLCPSLLVTENLKSPFFIEFWISHFDEILLIKNKSWLNSQNQVLITCIQKPWIG